MEARTDGSSEEQKNHEEQMEVMPATANGAGGTPEMANGEAAIVVVGEE